MATNAELDMAFSELNAAKSTADATKKWAGVITKHLKGAQAPLPPPTPAPAPTPPPTPNPLPASALPKVGIAPGMRMILLSDADRRRELDEIAAAGGKVVRVDLLNDSNSIAKFEQVVDYGATKGIKAIACLHGTTGPRSVDNFGEAMAAKFKGRCEHFEPGNEPDLHGWQPDGYASWFKGTAISCRKGNSACKMIAGALWKGSGIAPLQFTDALIAGAKGWFDYISLHLYDDALERGNWNIWDMAYPWQGGFYNGNTVREKLDRANLAMVPIISTESGGPYQWDGSPKYSETKRALIVQHALQEVQKGKIACCCIYSWWDDDVVGFGIKGKPAEAAYRTEAAKLAAG